MIANNYHSFDFLEIDKVIVCEPNWMARIVYKTLITIVNHTKIY